jgi:hypothetical protein
MTKDWNDAHRAGVNARAIADAAPRRTKSRVVQLATDTGVVVIRLIQSSREFVAGYVAPQYVIEGVLQQRRIYALTGRTGEGKTAVKLCLSRHLAQRAPIGKREVERCRVLYMAGENPDDVIARWIAMAEVHDFDPDTIDVHFIPGTFKISAFMQRVEKEVEAIGGVGAIMVDTSAAFFEGDEENDNVQAGDHARMLRQLTKLRGEPCVIVGCHPTKHATNENMLPRGGGAFLNEVDGNLTCIATDRLVKVHWCGKFRGVDFEPLGFELCNVTADRLRDAKGRHVWTVIAKPIDEARQNMIEATARADQDQVLLVLDQSPGIAVSKIAEALSWHTSNGEPHKSKVHRCLKRLEGESLAQPNRGTWHPTNKGKKTAKQLREGA